MKINKLIIIAIPSLLITNFSNASQPQIAAKTIITRGICKAQTNDDDRKLNRGSDIYINDVITTGDKSSIKMRFIDASFLSLTPNSKFRIDKYQFKKGDKNNKGKITLISGGLKSITGLINKNNPNALDCQCGNIATIGIRGTNYEADASSKSCGVHVRVGELKITAKKLIRKKGQDQSNTFETYSFPIKAGDEKNTAVITQKGYELMTYKHYKTKYQHRIRGNCQ